jgi:hypothetical protein
MFVSSMIDYSFLAMRAKSKSYLFYLCVVLGVEPRALRTEDTSNHFVIAPSPQSSFLGWLVGF